MSSVWWVAPPVNLGASAATYPSARRYCKCCKAPLGNGGSSVAVQDRAPVIAAIAERAQIKGGNMVANTNINISYWEREGSANPSLQTPCA